MESISHLLKPLKQTHQTLAPGVPYSKEGCGKINSAHNKQSDLLSNLRAASINLVGQREKQDIV
jgi:hypothetical protein